MTFQKKLIFPPFLKIIIGQKTLYTQKHWKCSTHFNGRKKSHFSVKFHDGFYEKSTR